MSVNLMRLIKKAAMEAVENSKPTEIVFGTVENISPLEIRISQKIVLSEAYLIKSASLNNISINDKLVLLQMQGGQQFLVMDVIEDDT